MSRQEILVEWKFGYHVGAMAIEIIRDPALRNDRNGAHSLIPQMPTVPEILIHRPRNGFSIWNVRKESARDGHQHSAPASGRDGNGIERLHPAPGVQPCFD